MTATRDEPLRVLFIGNSYTYCHDMPALLSVLSRSGRPIQTQWVAAGGATLQRHWEDGAALARITSQYWDYVVLQEQSTRPIEDPVCMHRYVRLFAEKILASGSRPLLYLTWARKSDPASQSALNVAYRAIADEVEGNVAPVGPAWLHSVANCDIELYDQDGSHPTLAGAFLTACVFHQVLVGSEAGGFVDPTEGLSKTQQATLKRLASEALRQ